MLKLKSVEFSLDDTSRVTASLSALKGYANFADALHSVNIKQLDDERIADLCEADLKLSNLTKSATEFVNDLSQAINQLNGLPYEPHRFDDVCAKAYALHDRLSKQHPTLRSPVEDLLDELTTTHALYVKALATNSKRQRAARRRLREIGTMYLASNKTPIDFGVINRHDNFKCAVSTADLDLVGDIKVPTPHRFDDCSSAARIEGMILRSQCANWTKDYVREQREKQARKEKAREVLRTRELKQLLGAQK